MTAAQVAERCSCSPKQVYAWAAEKPPRLPAVRFGLRLVRFDPEDVERFIQSAREAVNA
jgi:excisionase family DNA binding protein